jgi:molybdenum cofactor cytidylyltransferase
MSALPVVGILLAAGSASRFGGGKLAVQLPGGTAVAVAALTNLAAAVDSVTAVVRPGDSALAALLAAHGARVSVCPTAGDGMGASLAWGVRSAPVAAGWIIALADMPWVDPHTIAGVVSALKQGALLAAPRFQHSRGHPVGIAACHYAELAALSGDEGAKRLLAANLGAVQFVDVGDAGILRDIDTPADLTFTARE